MKEEITQIKEELELLKKRLDSLGSTTTIPLDVDRAFRSRLQIINGDTSTASAGTYTQAVDESGASTYSVAKPMSGFITITINGNARKVPYYN